MLTRWALLLVAIAGAPSSAADLGTCPLFPANSIWNVPVDTLPVDANSGAYIQTIGLNVGLHPDFGTFYKGAPIGIPFITVPLNQPLVDITFEYADESDPGPYPIPPNAPIEGGARSDGDRHILIVQTGEDGAPCTLWETWSTYPIRDAGGIVSWTAGSGARWDLTDNALRPDTWTSADAAGLPILPGLVRYDEALSGEIRHAIRFTCVQTRKAHVWPARHDASSSLDPARPPMGQRFRLKSNVDISGFTPIVKTILQAMKTYGVILADNGSNWYVTGTHDLRWNDDELAQLSQIKGSQFEAVDVSALQVDADSGEALVALAADINGDGSVNGADLAIVLASWGPTSGGDADLDHDGDVDAGDLAAVLGAWTTTG